MIEREEYLNRLIAWKDKQIIKVVTGIRRCGKSTLMEMFQDYLLSNEVTAQQIISINFEDYAYSHLLDPQKLYEYLLENLSADSTTYIFLDEIQNVKNFEKVVDSLFLKKNIDITITGSNAYLLSGELATHISGRYITIEMLPLSFAEYVKSTGSPGELNRKFVQYIETSSFPYVFTLGGNQREIHEYLQGIYSTVILKDVVDRYGISDVMMLESVLSFIFDNIGSQLSTRKISNSMLSAGRKIDVKTVEKYLSALLNSYILYQAKRYDVKGKQYLKTLDKYYIVDVGLRSLLLGKRSIELGHVLENVVYLELLRRGFRVFVGKVDDTEVDFVALHSGGIIYYQVAASVRDEKTLHRELLSLQKIPDHYPKYILTLDNDPIEDFLGIKKINVLDWLLNTSLIS
ncbi:MAG: ATP-binding protein [Caldisericia bacterium]|nr:ATP-binding protein [Caldisericia bacterium]